MRKAPGFKGSGLRGLGFKVGFRCRLQSLGLGVSPNPSKLKISARRSRRHVVRGSPKIEVPFWGRHNKEHSILRSILRPVVMNFCYSISISNPTYKCP